MRDDQYPVLRAHEKVVEDLNRQMDEVVDSFLRQFCGLRTEIKGDKIVKTFKRSQGALILLWRTKNGRRYGPYWLRCNQRKKNIIVDGEILGERSIWTYDHIGVQLPSEQRLKFRDKHEAHLMKEVKKWKDRNKDLPDDKKEPHPMNLDKNKKSKGKIGEDYDWWKFVRDDKNWKKYKEFDNEINALGKRRGNILTRSPQ